MNPKRKEKVSGHLIKQSTDSTVTRCIFQLTISRHNTLRLYFGRREDRWVGEDDMLAQCLPMVTQFDIELFFSRKRRDVSYTKRRETLSAVFCHPAASFKRGV